jgi:hypothetical protein
MYTESVLHARVRVETLRRLEIRCSFVPYDLPQEDFPLFVRELHRVVRDRFPFLEVVVLGGLVFGW